MSENPYLPEDVAPEEELPALPSPASEERRGCSPNAVSILFLVLTGLFLVYFGTLLVNPYLSINPFPPRTPLPIYVVATADPAVIAAELASPTKPPDVPRLTTLVPTITASPTETVTPLPTLTQMVVAPPRVATSTSAAPTLTLVGAQVPDTSIASVFTPPAPVDLSQVTRAPFPFTLANERVTYIPNPNDEGCRWASIAGAVVGSRGESVAGLAVRVIGEGIDEIRFTGTAPAYGAGGYEVFLNGAPLDSQYTVQLLSQTGAPISDAFSVTTQASCETNVAVVSFVQNHTY